MGVHLEGCLLLLSHCSQPATQASCRKWEKRAPTTRPSRTPSSNHVDSGGGQGLPPRAPARTLGAAKSAAECLKEVG